MRLAFAAWLAALPLLAPGIAVAQDLKSTSAPLVLPDPVPGQGANFSPSAATATEAYGGPPRGTPAGDPCTPYNPCALPSSAPRELGPLVTTLKPPREAVAESAAPSRSTSLR